MSKRVSMRANNTAYMMTGRKEYLETKRNLHFLDEGSFGAVYDLDNKNRVLKIGRVDDDHYMQWVRAVGLNNSNPNLPRIYSAKVFDIARMNPYSEAYYEVIMEKLLSYNEAVDRLIDREQGYVNAEAKLQSYWTARNIEEYTDFNDCDIEDTNPNCKYLIEVRNMLRKMYAHGFTADVVERNVMWRFRGSKFDAVFTDPIV